MPHLSHSHVVLTVAALAILAAATSVPARAHASGSPCTDNSQCAADREICQGGRCVAGCPGPKLLCSDGVCRHCCGDWNCEEGRFCDDGVCKKTRSECKHWEKRCSDGECRRCCENSDCREGRVCDNGVCKTKTTCESGEKRCSNGECRRCCTNSDCPSGKSCCQSFAIGYVVPFDCNDCCGNDCPGQMVCYAGVCRCDPVRGYGGLVCDAERGVCCCVGDHDQCTSDGQCAHPEMLCDPGQTQR